MNHFYNAMLSGIFDSDTPTPPSIEGSLVVTGRNNSGQLGLGDTTNRSSYTQVGSETDWNNIWAGWGRTFVQRDNKVYCCGDNSYGGLGLGDETDRSNLTQISNEPWDMVSCGKGHTLAIINKKLYSCGLNYSGQLGLGDYTNRSSFTQVGNDNWIYVSAGGILSLAIREDKKLFFFGDNRGLERYSSPVQVGDLSWDKVGCGNQHYIGLSQGKVYGGGWNNYGQLGTGDTTNKNCLSPVQVGKEDNWSDISVGWGTNGGLRNKKLFTWGYGNYGLLGNGLNQPVSSPIQIGNEDWDIISYNYLNAYGKVGDTWYGWGYGGYGILYKGSGDLIDYWSPVQLGQNFKKLTGGSHLVTLL